MQLRSMSQGTWWFKHSFFGANKLLIVIPRTVLWCWNINSQEYSWYMRLNIVKSCSHTWNSGCGHKHIIPDLLILHPWYHHLCHHHHHHYYWNPYLLILCYTGLSFSYHIVSASDRLDRRWWDSIDSWLGWGAAGWLGGGAAGWPTGDQWWVGGGAAGWLGGGTAWLTGWWNSFADWMVEQLGWLGGGWLAGWVVVASLYIKHIHIHVEHAISFDKRCHDIAWELSLLIHVGSTSALSRQVEV